MVVLKVPGKAVATVVASWVALRVADWQGAVKSPFDECRPGGRNEREEEGVVRVLQLDYHAARRRQGLVLGDQWFPGPEVLPVALRVGRQASYGNKGKKGVPAA
jgi:hypothetical protein